jgi:5-methyltetrahydrofolate--homocysteine methyltransferase
MTDIRARLAAGGIIVGDGAWGTMLMARGLRPGVPPETLNLERPEVIEEVARLYSEAGADFITTNTFGGSPLRLRAYGLEGAADAVNRGAVEAARRGAGARAWVAGSIGPSGLVLKPYGDGDPGEIETGFARQAEALASAGADFLIVETMTDLTEARLAVSAARRVAPSLAVMATMTFDRTRRGFFTVMGVTVAQAAAGLRDAGAEIIGSNCGNGIEAMLEIAREFRAQTDLPLAIQANAGLPESRDGQLVYPESPEFLASWVPALIAAGVKIVGGCCGTTPDHVRAVRAAVDHAAAASATGSGLPGGVR